MNLKEALTILLQEEHLGDFIYYVRERASYDRPRGCGTIDSWKLPRVVRFGEAVKALEDELRRMEGYQGGN